MHFLIALARKIDGLNQKIADAMAWALLFSVLICCANALMSYFFKIGSNAWLEIQWYLFAAVFLLGSSYTLKRNEHVRIDVITGRFSQRTQIWIDVFGYLFFYLPFTLLILYLGTPYALESLHNQEMSNNAGGLIVWPVKLLIPVSFFLMSLQGISELIKRIAYLQGHIEAKEFEKSSASPKEQLKEMVKTHLQQQNGDAK